MSLRMQFEKIGCGLLQEAFGREGECVLAKREGGNTQLNTQYLYDRNKDKTHNCGITFHS